MTRWLSVAVVAVLGALLIGAPAQAATSVKIQPLLYRDTLKKGEKKSGYVDVSNPNDAPTTYTFSVQAFRQVDDEGTLQFYDSEQVTSGLRLDVDKVLLEPKDVLRLHFTLDGARLPEGDVFAVIMAAAEPMLGDGTAVSVRAGTLFALTNGTVASRRAEITELSVPWLQLGDGMRAQLRLKNTAPENQATGFFPTIKVSAWPFLNKEVSGPLVFAGHSRTVSLVYPGNYAGILWVRASAGSNEKTAVSIVVTGWYRLALSAIAIALIVSMYILLHIWQRHTRGGVQKSSLRGRR